MADSPDNLDTRTSMAGFEVLPEGKRIGDRYRIIELIGLGAVGMVYRARDERLDMDVALKVMRPERVPDLQALERFKQELLLGRQVSHRNVVRIHDIGEDGDLRFLIMDHVEGQSLKRILDREGALGEEQAVAIARDLAEGLSAAHRESIVHRDLKPANVLVGDDRAYITDFGIARSLGTEGLTKTGVVVGTLEYLAPEQVRGGTVDGRTDIYALGLILFEMLTGKRPFGGETVEEVLAERTLGEPRSLADVDRSLPEYLGDIVAHCLERNPEDRYATADELAQDLSGGRFRRRARLARLAVPLAVTAVLGVAIALSSTVWRQLREPAAPRASAAAQIAVLPFEDRTGATEYDWVRTGLADLLSDDLAESPALSVTDPQRVLQTLEDLKQTQSSLKGAALVQLAELLDATRLITGRVYRIDDRLRIEAELLAVGPERWTRQVHVEGTAGTGIFELVSQLAAETRALLALPPVEHELIPRSLDPAARRAYARGVDLLAKGENLAAAEMLQEAVAADGEFPAAWFHLSDAYERSGRDREALEAVQQAAGALSSVTSRLGYEVRARSAALSGDLPEAIEILAKLVEAYPNDLEARVAYAEALGEHGRLGDAQQELEQVVAQSENHPQAWYLLGKYAILLGNGRAAADRYLVHALVIQNRLGNAQGQGDVLNALGIAHHHLGDLAQAEEYYHRAIRMREAAGDARGVAVATANLARIHAARGDHEGARAGLEAALEQLEDIGDRWSVANLHNEMGLLEEQQGSFESALERYRAGLQIRRDLGDQRALAESYNNVGFTYFMLGEYDNAAVYTEQALQHYRDTKNSEGEMIALQTSGLLNIALGQWDLSLKALLGALELGRELEHSQAQAVALGHIGRVQHYQGRFDAALSSYEQAMSLLKELEDLRGLVEFTLYESELLLELGMHDAARAALDQVGTWLEQEQNHEQLAELHRLESCVAAVEGDNAGALESAGYALQKATVSGSVVALLKAHLALARAHASSGAYAEAREIIRTVSQRADRLGHAVLRLEAMEALATVEQAAGRHDATAEAALRGLETASAHTPYRGVYRFELLLASSLDVLGRQDDSRAHYQNALFEISRLRSHLSDAALQSFDALPDIRKTGELTHVSD